MGERRPSAKRDIRRAQRLASNAVCDLAEASRLYRLHGQLEAAQALLTASHDASVALPDSDELEGRDG